MEVKETSDKDIFVDLECGSYALFTDNTSKTNSCGLISSPLDDGVVHSTTTSLLSVDGRHDKPKKKRAKKPPKPPRSTKLLPLDAAEQMFMNELAEIAMMKKARLERMNALKNMKNAKPFLFSCANLCAVLFTLLFCLVIVFQGVFSRNNMKLHFYGSPELVMGKSARLVSIHFYKSDRDIGNPISDSMSPRISESVTQFRQ